MYMYVRIARNTCNLTQIKQIKRTRKLTIYAMGLAVITSLLNGRSENRQMSVRIMLSPARTISFYPDASI